jgi:hypothetical protein
MTGGTPAAAAMRVSPCALNRGEVDLLEVGPAIVTSAPPPRYIVL